MPEEAADFLNLLNQKPIIKILIYTDDPEVADNEDSSFGIGRMKRLLKAHQPAFADVWVHLENRVPDNPATKLDRILDGYHQIWFFGTTQLNREELPPDFPDKEKFPSKFSKDELDKLSDWMNTGGVLMTGDHANPDVRIPIPESPNKLCPEGISHETFLCRGRALGIQVPRAGQLRKWKGPPTKCHEDNHNTQALLCGDDFDDPLLEIDSTPQQLILPIFDTKQQSPKPEPHALFQSKKKCRWIRVFPDHTHEGKIIIPADDDLGEEWQQVDGVRPKPYTVAYGIDKRNGEKYDLVAVYDGDRLAELSKGEVQAGRIVADSSWHHYFNDNLAAFETATGDDSVIDQIGQYYGNLALWLSPIEVRQATALHTLYWLANHPRVLEETGSGILSIGRTAYRILSNKAAPCEIRELLQVASPNEYRERYEVLYFPEESFIASGFPSQELLLGSIVNQYHQKMPTLITSTLSMEEKIMSVRSLFRKAFDEALSVHMNELNLYLSAALQYHLMLI